MRDLRQQLRAIPHFASTSREDLDNSLPLWSRVRVADGQVLWPRQQAAGELGVLLDGELTLAIGDVIAQRIRPGDLVGEAGAFFRGEVRSVDVLATRNSLVATLPASQLRALREARSSVYEALVRQAAISLVRRIRATSVLIAKHARTEREAPTRKEVSALVKMWRTLVPGGPEGDCPPLAPLLRRQPGLEQARGPAILALVPTFTRQSVAEGEVVFLEGEQGDAMYLIAHGSVDVLRHVRGGAKRLVTLQAGGQFGCNALVEPGARTASCVAAEPCWLYRIDAARFADPPPEAGLIWWESLLHNLGDQLRRSDDNLRVLVCEPEPEVELPTEADPLKALLDASGFRNEGDVYTSELEAMEVLYSDDQRRNWRND